MMGFKLIDEWRSSWRFGSVQLGMAAGAISAAIWAAAPTMVLQMLQSDLRTRIAIGILFGASVTLLPWLARVLKKAGGDSAE